MEPSSVKILIVDDVESARRVCRRLLEKNGFWQTQEASTGREALQLLRGGQYQLVISDWQMPDMDGLTLLREIQAEESLKEVKFIMITGSSEREYVIQALDAGVADYLVKPFSAEALVAKVRAVLGISPAPSN